MHGSVIGRGLGVAAVLTALLAACAGQLPGQTAAPTLAATVAVETAVAPAAGAPSIPLPPATIPAAPTLTPEPTITPGPSPTPAPEALLVAAVEPRLAAVLPAPDDMKRAEVIIYDCAAIGDDPNPRSLEILRIVDPAAATEYQIDSQFINCGGLGAFGLEPLAWGASGRAFYYTPAREGGPDGACRPWVRSIVRADLADWTLTTLEQAAGSPDGTRIAGWVNGELLVFALDGGELGRSAPAALPPFVGPPVWSPDGAALAYLQYTTGCGETAGESAVVLVDGTTFAPRVLLTSAAPEFAAVEWLDVGRLQLTALNSEQRWVYDLATGQLSPQ